MTHRIFRCIMSGMEWLNYHHLQYFWVVAREGSIARACEILRLAQPTISGQIRMLEETLGGKLFTRAGRGLVLTELGQVVFRYAEEIFSLGKEMAEVVQGRQLGHPLRLVVGITEVLPKLVAYRLLEPALQGSEPVRLICWEGKLDQLLADLALHRLDIVLADAPMSSISRVRAYSHLLVESGISLFAIPKMAAKFRRNFPKSLHEAPFLLPTDNTVLRRSLEQWFESENIRPTNAGEYEDSALLKAFGQAGCGIFAVPTLIEAEVSHQYRVRLVGHVPSIRERFYAISVERKLHHPAVLAISEAVKHIQPARE